MALRARLTPMIARDPREPHRVASSLELFFDLVFVIAVSTLGSIAHHHLLEGSLWHTIAIYLLAFEFVWWAWTNFTWFASSFDTDDWLYRLLTFVQMVGVLVLAAGIEPLFSDFDARVSAIGYVIMRVALVPQWLRAWHSSARGGSRSAQASGIQRATRIYAWGIVTLQVLWLVWAFVSLPPFVAVASLLVLMALELAVPVCAERRGQTQWHPHHIAERYGLFTIILLGESLLASATALLDALGEHHHVVELLILFVSTFATTAALWWVYFWPHHHAGLNRFTRVMAYGYIHYFLFASAGWMSVGVELSIDAVVGTAEYSPLVVRLAYMIPVMIFLLGSWLLVAWPQAPRSLRVASVVLGILMLATCCLPVGAPWFALLPTGFAVAFVVTLTLGEPAKV